MATTNDFKELDGNGFRVFISTLKGRKSRVSIVKGEDARNFNEGELVFQKTYSSWSSVPGSDIVAAFNVVGRVFGEG